MAIGSGSKTVIRTIVETVPGTTPATPTMKYTRFTGESLSTNINSSQSEEITPTRGVKDTIPTGIEPGGDLDYEYSNTTYEAFLESALQGTFTADFNFTGSVAFSRPVSTLIATVTSTTGLQTGQYVKISGSTQATQNGIFKLGAITATTAELLLKIGGDVTTVVLTGGGASIKINGKTLVNGTTTKAFTVEKEFTDLTGNKFFLFKGMQVDTWELNLEVDQIASGTFGFVGQDSTNPTTTAASANTAQTTTPVVNCVSNVGAIMDGATALGLAQSLQIQTNNNLRRQRVIGQFAAAGVAAGQLEVSGTIEIFFSGQDYLARALNATESAFSVVLTDSAGSTTVVSMPRIKFTNVETTADGNDADVIANVDYQALLDANNVAIRIDVF